MAACGYDLVVGGGGKAGESPASVQRIDGEGARELCPVLRACHVAASLFEPYGMDLDLNAIHRGFLKGLRQRAGCITTNAEVLAVQRHGSQWLAEAFAVTFTGNAVVSRADQVGQIAAASPVGLVAKRSTCILFDAPQGMVSAGWPGRLRRHDRSRSGPRRSRTPGPRSHSRRSGAQRPLRAGVGTGPIAAAGIGLTDATNGVAGDSRQSGLGFRPRSRK